MFYLRTSFQTNIDELTLIGENTLTRQMGIYLEINKFLESPIFGNGFFYYMDQFYEMLGNARALTSQFAYAAFNHIGIISTLDQGGIIGFLTIIIFPCYLFLNFTCMTNEDKLIKEIFLLYFISFFISGSPIVNDFPLGFFYYLTVGYMYTLFKRQKRIFKFNLKSY